MFSVKPFWIDITHTCPLLHSRTENAKNTGRADLSKCWVLPPPCNSRKGFTFRFKRDLLLTSFWDCYRLGAVPQIYATFLLLASLDPWTAICTCSLTTLTITACCPRPRLLYRYQQLHSEDHVLEEREQLCSLSTTLVSSNVSMFLMFFPPLPSYRPTA